MLKIRPPIPRYEKTENFVLSLFVSYIFTYFIYSKIVSHGFKNVKIPSNAYFQILSVYFLPPPLINC